MLIASGLPTKFWAESCINAVLIQNTSLTKTNGSISASEKWSGEKPYVSKIRTFGCRVLVKDSNTKEKFTIRTWDGINIGPAQGRDGYKIYDPSTKHMNVTHDVHFLEG